MKRAILLAFALALVTPRASALARPLSRVEAAIRYVNPRVARVNVRSWARVIRAEAIARRFDPYTLIAIVRFESGFNPGVVNNNPPREYSVGLSQINALALYRTCREPPILSAPSCQSSIAALTDGAHNLRTAARLITGFRDHCRRRTGKPALFARWLSAFQGYDSRPGVTCNMRRDRRGRWRDLPAPTLTRRVMRYRRELVRAIR